MNEATGSASTYLTLALDTLTVINTGTIPPHPTATSKVPLISKDEYVWSVRGWAGGMLSNGTVDWDAFQLHTLNPVVAQNTANWDIHPLTGELFYAYADSFRDMFIARASWVSATLSVEFIDNYGTSSGGVGAGPRGVAVTSNGAMVVSFIYNSSPDVIEIISTDFSTVNLLFTETLTSTSGAVATNTAADGPKPAYVATEVLSTQVAVFSILEALATS